MGKVMTIGPKHALYFGTLRTAGHYLWFDNYKRTTSVRGAAPGFPWDERLVDGGLLKNRQVPDVEDGRVHWVCGGDPIWLGFFWWDNSIDSRPGSNSGFYVSGFFPADRAAAFAYALEQWPEVVSRQRFPLTLFEDPTCQGQ